MTESKKYCYDLLKTLVQTHQSVSMETDSFAHGQGASNHLYLNGECVTRDYFTAPDEYNELAFLFFEYFQDTYEEGFESDHQISFHLNNDGDLYADRVDYASSNYFGDELSIDPLISEFRYYFPTEHENAVEFTDSEITKYMRYHLEFTVSHSWKDELMVGFKATQGRKKRPVPLPFKLHQQAQKIQDELDRCAQGSFQVLRAAYPRYDHSLTLSGDMSELYRDEYSLNVYKTVSPDAIRAIFEAER